MPSFFFNDPATTEISPLPLHDGSSDLAERPRRRRARLRAGGGALRGALDDLERRSEEHTSELQSRLNLKCPPFFLMIRRPPRSPLFPYTTALPILQSGLAGDARGFALVAALYAAL